MNYNDFERNVRQKMEGTGGIGGGVLGNKPTSGPTRVSTVASLLVEQEKLLSVLGKTIMEVAQCLKGALTPPDASECLKREQEPEYGSEIARRIRAMNVQIQDATTALVILRNRVDL